MPRVRAILSLTVAALVACAGSTASAQNATVFIDDSVTATETLGKLPDLLSAGNLTEAARVAQLLLDTDADRLVASGVDPEVYVSVRSRVMRELLRNRDLLAKYREVQEPRAAQLLSEGRHHDVERSRLLTAAGFEAGLRVAQEHLERARFSDAARVLITLSQHPDASGPLASRAASMALQLSAYSAAPDVTAAANAWKKESDKAPAKVTPPARAGEVARDSSDPAGVMDRASLAAPPLSLGAIARWIEDSGASGTPAQAWTWPAVAGEIIVTNDGVEIAAWDRWTLVNLWRFRATDDEGRDSLPIAQQSIEQFSRLIEQPTTVGVGQGIVVAATGFANTTSLRSGDGIVHAVSLATGEHLWSVDVASLEKSLADGIVRGRPLVESDTAVIPVSRTSQGRRVGSSLLVGLDASSGAVKWVRPVASIGIGSYRPAVRPADNPTASDGVVYHADTLGVVEAIEASSGRPLWARSLVPAPEQGSPFGFVDTARRNPWATNAPLLDGSDLLVLEPGTGDLVRLRRADGAIVARRTSADLNGGRYLVRVGDSVAAVGVSVITLLPLADIQNGPTRIGPRLTEIEITGRVVGAGSSIVIPVRQGLLVQDLSGNAKPELIPLRSSGQVLVADGQVVIASATELHGYHEWSAVEPRLRAFIKSRPNDPGPALTFIDVATRAGKAAAVSGVADSLLSLLDTDPTDPSLASARRRLFDQLAALVGQSHSSGKVTLAEADALVERLDRAADSPSQHAHQRLLRAWVQESLDHPAQAVEALQQVLAEPGLASVLVPPFPGEDEPMRSGGEVATRKLAALLSARGYGPYEPFAAQAEQEWAALGGAAGDVRKGVELAKRYPLARVTPAIWLAVGRAAKDDVAASLAAYGSAADAAARLARVLKQQVSPELADASGALVTALSASNRLAPLARYLATLTRDFPMLAPTFEGKPIDITAARNLAAAGLAELERRPIAGTAITSSVQTLAGWTIVRPRFVGGKGVATDHLPMASLLSKQVGLWAVGAADGELSPLWTRDFDREDARPTFLKLWWDRTLLYRPGLAGPSLELITIDGRTAWHSPEFETLLPPEPVDPEGTMVETPLDGQVARMGVVAAISDRVAVIARRNGRAAGFDLSSGKSVWAQKLPIDSVYDTAMVGGRLVVIGLTIGANGSRVLLFDEVTGQLTLGLGGPDSPVRFNSRPRWVRAAGGLAVVGFDDSIIAIDPASGEIRWKLTGENAAGSVDAWPLAASSTDDRLVVQGSNNVLWVIRAADANAVPVAISAGDKLGDPSRRRAIDIPVNAAFAAGENTGLVSSRGLVVFDAKGAAIGRDIMPDRDEKLFAIGQSSAAFLDSAQATRLGDSHTNTYTLRLLSLPGGLMTSERGIVLYDQPSELAVLDGKVAVSAGPVTLVIDTATK